MTLAVEGLRAGYGRVEVLHDVSFTAGEAGLAILGPNGAGKTTLLKALSGLVKISSGSAQLDGATITGLPPDQVVRRGIVHVPQGRRILGSMTVLENLKIAAYTAPDARAVSSRIDEVLDLFPRLRAATGRKGIQMSGGEQQMLAVARALMIPASVMLLDEPSDGLAPMIVRDLARVLRSIREDMRLPMIIVEQNPWLAQQVADQCVVLVAGRIAAAGQTDEVAEPARMRRLYLAG